MTNQHHDGANPHRRSFLKAGAAAAGLAMLPASVRRALALPAHRATGTIQDVQHVVILMQENRSFDHYFGALRGVRGYGDPRTVPLPGGGSVFHQPVPGQAGQVVLPFRLNTATTSASCLKSLDHSWKGTQAEWNGWDAWIGRKTPFTMGHVTREDIPFYYALADAFTICDAYHASIFGPTDPNRLYLFSGTSGLSVGDHGPQVTSNGDDRNWTADPALDRHDFPGFGWTTYSDRLTGAGVSWRLYQEYDNFGDNSLAYFRQYRNLPPDSEAYRRARAIVPGSTPENAKTSGGAPLVAAFEHDVAAGTLPQVSWIVAPAELSEHPDASPGFGEVMISRIVDVLVRHPEVWSKTVFIINYDENDGFFDHVPAPVPALGAAAGHCMVSVAGEVHDGVPVGLGPRVPMLVVSPWSKGGWVNSELFDHTSVLRFLEARFGVHEPNITPWRRAMTGDLTSAFDFASPDGAWEASLPATSSYVEQVTRSCHLGRPVVPAGQAMPIQEPGQRPARPLPYVIQADADATPAGIGLQLDNRGRQGATFLLYEADHPEGPRHYSITAGGAHLDRIGYQPDGRYRLRLFGPNGYYREFDGRRPATEAEPLQVEAACDPAAGQLVLTLVNRGPSHLVVQVADESYGAAPRHHALAPGARLRDRWDLAASDHWYDLSVRPADGSGYGRRYAGHMETGQPSRTDPAIARLRA